MYLEPRGPINACTPPTSQINDIARHQGWQPSQADHPDPPQRTSRLPPRGDSKLSVANYPSLQSHGLRLEPPIWGCVPEGVHRLWLKTAGQGGSYYRQQEKLFLHFLKAICCFSASTGFRKHYYGKDQADSIPKILLNSTCAFLAGTQHTFKYFSALTLEFADSSMP